MIIIFTRLLVGSIIAHFKMRHLKLRSKHSAVISSGVPLKLQFNVMNTNKTLVRNSFTLMNVIMHRVDEEESDVLAYGDIVYITHAISGRILYGSRFSKSTKWKFNDKKLHASKKCHFKILGSIVGKPLSMKADFSLESLRWPGFVISSRKPSSIDWAANLEQELRIVPKEKLQEQCAFTIRVVKVFGATSSCMSNEEKSMAIVSMLF